MYHSRLCNIVNSGHNDTMRSPAQRRLSLQDSGKLALQALRLWTLKQYCIALGAGMAIAVTIGVATVLIPNPVFGRDIPPVWWNYPVWIVTSLGLGMLIVTYVNTNGPGQTDTENNRRERNTSRLGMTGGILAWFAVGCPVCNKIALLALGYTGAITWFTPVQPFLALSALVLTGIALIWRLRGQVMCDVPQRPAAEVKL